SIRHRLEHAVGSRQLHRHAVPFSRYTTDTWCVKGTSTKLGFMQETTPAAPEHPQITAEHRELLDQLLDKWSLMVLGFFGDRWKLPLDGVEHVGAVGVHPRVGGIHLRGRLRRLGPLADLVR